MQNNVYSIVLLAKKNMLYTHMYVYTCFHESGNIIINSGYLQEINPAAMGKEEKDF